MSEAKVILFQGDSIADAGRNRELCDANCRSGLGTGYPLLAASRLLADAPDAGLQILNRGISGNRVVDLYARWKADTLHLQPDLLSILIGVNDCWHERTRQNGVEVPRYARIYRMLLEWTREVLPEIKLVLIEPFVLPCGAVDETWLPEMAERGAIVRKLAEDFQAGFVPAQAIFNKATQTVPPEFFAQDGVHPTAAANQLLADAWIAEVRKQGWLK